MPWSPERPVTVWRGKDLFGQYIVEPLLMMLNDDHESQRPADRIVIKVNANSGDSFSSIWMKLLDGVVWKDIDLQPVSLRLRDRAFQS